MGDQRYKIMDVRKDNSKQWRSYKKVEIQYVNKKGQKKWKSTNDDKIHSKFNPSYPRKPLQIEEHKHERNESLLIKYKSNEPKLRKIGECNKEEQIKYVTKLLQESTAHC